jgi:hypothetical protein
LYIFLGPWLKLQGSRGQREREREKFLDNH